MKKYEKIILKVEGGKDVILRDFPFIPSVGDVLNVSGDWYKITEREFDVKDGHYNEDLSLQSLRAISIK